MISGKEGLAGGDVVKSQSAEGETNKSNKPGYPPKTPNAPGMGTGAIPIMSMSLGMHEGTYLLDDGSVYVGVINDRVPHGKGQKMDHRAGVELSGSFVNGRMVGQGKLTTVTGATYTGQFDDVIHGSGTYTWKDGSTYVGSFIRGLKEGQGEYTGPSGNVYSGSFKNDQFDGEGSYTNAGNGVRYSYYVCTVIVIFHIHV